MKRMTVRNRILISNALMVIVTLFLFLVINLGIVKVYSETVETEFKATAQQMIEEDALEEMLENFTIRRNEFLLLFALDGFLCIVGLVAVSQLFTRNLANYIMKPLDALTEGASRIKDNRLTENITYTGGIEFEQVCEAFNEMQEHLQSEQDKNRRYEKARTDMIAGISHDLRTPLTAVRGAVKGLLDGVVSTPEQKEHFLQTAYRRTGDMDILLNQLFYLSRMETGNVPFSMQEVKLDDFVRNYVRGKQDFLEPSEELTAQPGTVRAIVQADPEQLNRILDNLLENSRKYAKAVPLKMKVTLQDTDKGVRIGFHDNGGGVMPEELPKIFEQFYRADASRNQKKGNGLGLYIVKYLTEAMGGQVYAQNEEGLAVYMELPTDNEKVQEEKEERQDGRT